MGRCGRLGMKGSESLSGWNAEFEDVSGNEVDMKIRIQGIDYLRAIVSVFVVIWHMGGGGCSLIFSKEAYLGHVLTLSDFVNFHLLLLAVPTFIFISIYLYASKPICTTSLTKQLSRILVLLSF